MQFKNSFLAGSSVSADPYIIALAFKYLSIDLYDFTFLLEFSLSESNIIPDPAMIAFSLSTIQQKFTFLSTVQQKLTFLFEMFTSS